MQRDPRLKALLELFAHNKPLTWQDGTWKEASSTTVLNDEYPLNYYLVKAAEHAYADNVHTEATVEIPYVVKAFGGNKGKMSDKRGFGSDGLYCPGGFSKVFMSGETKSNSRRFLSHLEVPPASSQHPTSTL